MTDDETTRPDENVSPQKVMISRDISYSSARLGGLAANLVRCGYFGSIVFAKLISINLTRCDNTRLLVLWPMQSTLPYTVSCCDYSPPSFVIAGHAQQFVSV